MFDAVLPTVGFLPTARKVNVVRKNLAGRRIRLNTHPLAAAVVLRFSTRFGLRIRSSVRTMKGLAFHARSLWNNWNILRPKPHFKTALFGRFRV
jgi:hypothetical protein